MRAVHIAEKKNRAIEEFEKRLKKCPACGKAKICEDDGKYCIQCNCIVTNKQVTIEWIPSLVSAWNKIH